MQSQFLPDQYLPAPCRLHCDMSSDRMPLSPAPSNNGEILQHGLHHVAQHNANSPYSQPDEGIHMQSSYGSPLPPSQIEKYSYRSQPRYVYQQHGQRDSGVGFQNQYESYTTDHQPSMMYQEYGTPASSSPTPSMMSQEGMRTRSGYAIPRAQHSLRSMPDHRRSEKSPKPKKQKKEKVKAEKKVAKLDRPLSELTKDWQNVPVVDIDAYVNRSAETRRKEVLEGKAPGKVKRPMNSFMLYRKAYQNRTKDWCLQNNHQVVSQVCGDSWPLEPEEVKQQFSEWARIERQNHQNAHPGYKFSPTKPGTTKSAKRKASEKLSEESDLDDFDWQGSRPRSSRKRAPMPMHRQNHSVAYPSTQSAYHYPPRDDSAEPLYGGYNKSLYHTSNPGRPMPVQYDQNELHSGQYYQQSVHHNPNMHGVEDVMIRKAMAPGGHSYLGLPGREGYNMMSQNDGYQLHSGYDLKEIDHFMMEPSQPRYGRSHRGNGGSPEEHLLGDDLFLGKGHNTDTPWQELPFEGLGDQRHHQYDTTLNYIDPELDGNIAVPEPHAHSSKTHQESWHGDTLETGPEFDKWMDDEDIRRL